MEISSRFQDRENPSPMNSPKSNVSNCMSSSNSNGIQIPTPPLTPKTIPRSDSNPYPTTFVQADTSTFKQNSGFSPRKPEILSPSLLDFPSLALSPVTPLNDDPFDKSSPSLGNSSEEDKAIAEKGFYLHPSPITTPRDSEPQLLPLFPVTSPRVSQSPS
ncbi:hypothetical protein SESBI_27281 [Sesbania bispinosa]|nr:hypothetical protein SESBI_27281 [Sesbania bispinosa]